MRASGQITTLRPEHQAPPTESPGRRPVVPFYVLAFLSGTAALCYEVTWARMLALTFGNATLAAAGANLRKLLNLLYFALIEWLGLPGD